MRTSNASSPGTRVIELVGPAGAGKSTLSRELAGQGRVQVGTMWEARPGSLVLDSLASVPTLARMSLRARVFAWEEFKYVVRARHLRRRLRRAPPGTVLVLDEGPVFVLAWLLTTGRPRFDEGELHAWWRRMVVEWVGDLDLVVRLDAADEVLMDRIRSRVKPHQVKEASDAQMLAFLARFRCAFDRVLEEAAAVVRPTVLRCDGGRERGWLAGRVMAALGDGCHDG